MGGRRPRGEGVKKERRMGREWKGGRLEVCFCCCCRVSLLLAGLFLLFCHRTCSIYQIINLRYFVIILVR